MESISMIAFGWMPIMLLIINPIRAQRPIERFAEELGDGVPGVEALELADRIVVMRDGRIEQVGTPDQIYDEPNSPFMFSFIGESSALPVTEPFELRRERCLRAIPERGEHLPAQIPREQEIVLGHERQPGRSTQRHQREVARVALAAT